jgi:hypothetical protein
MGNRWSIICSGEGRIERRERKEEMKDKRRGVGWSEVKDEEREGMREGRGKKDRQLLCRPHSEIEPHTFIHLPTSINEHTGKVQTSVRALHKNS